MRPPPQHLQPLPDSNRGLAKRLYKTLEALSSDLPLAEVADTLSISVSTLNQNITIIKRHYRARTLRGLLLMYHGVIKHHTDKEVDQ
jgi:hypothetical protein